MKTYAFRLHRGDDLRRSLEQFARARHLQGAVILSCVGCLSHWRLRDASGVRIQEGAEHVEIVSATGTLSQERLHIHLSLSREDLSCLGGHLAEGCLVNTTAEVVLLELEDVAFGGAYDAATGYQELVIRPAATGEGGGSAGASAPSASWQEIP